MLFAVHFHPSNTCDWLFMMHLHHLLSVLVLITISAIAAANSGYQKTCVIQAAHDGTDDSPAIRKAFHECGREGHIIFQENSTYNVQSTLELRDLDHVQIDMLGTILVRSLSHCAQSVAHNQLIVLHRRHLLDTTWLLVLVPEHFHCHGVLRRTHHHRWA